MTTKRTEPCLLKEFVFIKEEKVTLFGNFCRGFLSLEVLIGFSLIIYQSIGDNCENGILDFPPKYMIRLCQFF